MVHKKRVGLPAVGVCALLTAFAVLCLTVFSTLCVATVQADLRLAERAGSAVTAGYAVEAEAQRILARLRGGEEPEGVERDGNRYRFVCPVEGMGRQLTAEVELHGADYRILRWQLQPVGEWVGNENLPVWNGEEE